VVLKNMRRILVLLGLIAAGAATAYYVFPDWFSAPAETSYRVAKVDRGDIVATVNATGTINPTTTIIVSSQLSGQVVEILADYNSAVKAKQVLARLNSDQIRAKLDAARADLAQMRANKLVQEGMIQKVRADTEKAKATLADAESQVDRNEVLLADAERIFQRQSDLKGRGFASDATFETARATRDAQQAALNSAKAQVDSAKAAIAGLAADLQVAQANAQAVTAQIAQREATVRQIEVDLRNTEIKSPVSGVVVQRNVELGQTVAASLQAPTLFLISDDLHHMEIAANIDETDVGRVKSGQRVTFSVNAYPGRNFEGTVKQVRLGSQTVQNVVIYTTIVSVENPRLELLPGMTANLRVETDRRENVVRVPNAALRWRPPNLVTEAGSSPSPQPESARPRGGRDLAQRFDKLKAELKLRPEQQKDIEAALKEARKAFAGGGGDDQTARRERARAARQELDSRIVAVLDPDQRAKFDEIRKNAAGGSATSRAVQTARLFVVGSDGKPEGVTVQIGATDGGVTEIVAGLDAGREVIIGGGPPAPTRPARFGFR
jgi:HlyD family secretion protein